MEKLVAERLSAGTSDGLIVDLKPIGDKASRAAQRATIEPLLGQMNAKVQQAGKEPVPVVFIDP